MSSHRTDAPAHAGDDAERIAAELRALGEPELARDERDAAPDAAAPDAAVLVVFALAHPPAGDHGVPLDDVASARVWRKLAVRVPKQQSHAVPRTLRARWVAVATAAGIALVPLLGGEVRRTPFDPGAHAKAEALGEQARAALETMPGSQDGARARELAERLRGGGGAAR